MRISSFLSFASALRTLAIFGAFFGASFLSVNAQTSTFAQFLQNGGGQNFVFTNNTASADFDTVSGGSPIFFFYQGLPFLDASLQGPQSAHLFITTTTTTPASVEGGGTLAQPLDQVVTLTIIRDTPAPPGVGNGTRTVLLTAVITPGGSQSRITGSGNSATWGATTPASSDQTIVFTSDFLSFAATTQRNLALSFSSVNPGMALGSGSFLQSFTAAGSGTFASNPLPTLPPPSTAAPVSLSGRVLTQNGSGVRNALVTLITEDGSRRTVRTGTFGNFEFTSIRSGQTVIVSAVSKQYTFPSQAISLEDNITGVDLSADPE